ncbi:MAG: hypothetical protein R3185_08010, partial [Candidatus Thermoplasmatota archaeon]|nr:hypothetical protein [Candidatus Thermoplasmatota archaeon]
VGAAVALILEENPELKRKDASTVKRIKTALVESAQAIQPGTGHHDRYGYGLVQVDQALDRI